jgi:hypothetical protein
MIARRITRRTTVRSKRPGDVLDPETLDDIASANVFVVLEGHAAFLPGIDFGDLVLEALQSLELAFVNDNAVADEANARATLDLALGDAATGHLADLGDVEHLQDLGIAEEGLPTFRREHAGHRRFHVIHQIVNDVVVADLDTVALGRIAGLLVGTHVEADDCSTRCLGKADIGLGDGAGTRMDDPGLDLVGAELLDGTGNGFDRALHVALDQKRKLLAAGVLQLRHHLLERTAGSALARRRLVAGKPLAVFGDLTGTAFILDDGKAVAGLRRALKAENFNRESGSGFLDVLATVIDQRADTAPLVAGNENFARLDVCRSEPERWQPNRGHDRAWPRSRHLRRCDRGWP